MRGGRGPGGGGGGGSSYGECVRGLCVCGGRGGGTGKGGPLGWGAGAGYRKGLSWVWGGGDEKGVARGGGAYAASRGQGRGVWWLVISSIPTVLAIHCKC